MSEGPRVKPPEATPVIPPDGVVMHDYGQNHFGLASMTYTEVHDRHRSSGAGFIEGTILRFLPGEVHVNTRRQDLTAAEINRIGELARAIHDNRIIDRYLSQVKKAAESATSDLRAFAWSTPDVTHDTTPKEIDAKAEKVLGDETGINNEFLEEKQRALKEKLDALNQEAHGLSVVHLSRLDSGWGYNVTPPKETAETPKE